MTELKRQVERHDTVCSNVLGTQLEPMVKYRVPLTRRWSPVVTAEGKTRLQKLPCFPLCCKQGVTKKW